MNYLIEMIFESFDPKQKYPCIVISQIITHAIYDEDIPLGLELPSSARLGKFLKLSSSTTSRAYANLKNVGLLETVIGKGTRITTVLPSLGNFKSPPQLVGFVDQHGKIISFNSVDPRQFDVEGFSREMARKYYEAEMCNAALRLAQLQREITERTRTKINRSLGVCFTYEQVLFGYSFKQVLGASCDNFLQMREVVAITEKSPRDAAILLRFCSRELHEITEDEEGMVTADLEQLCQNKKVGMVYLNSGSSHLSQSQMSAARIAHLLELSHTYQFVIVEDDRFRNFLVPYKNDLVKAAQKVKGRVIYFRPLTFAHPSMSRIIVACGSAVDIRKLQERLAGVADALSFQLTFAIHEVIVSGKLIRAENRIKRALKTILPTASRILQSTGHWQTETVLNPTGWYYKLTLTRGKFLPNLFTEMEKKRLYLIDPAKLINGESNQDTVILSLAGYVCGQHLEIDLQYFNEKISGFIKD